MREVSQLQALAAAAQALWWTAQAVAVTALLAREEAPRWGLREGGAVAAMGALSATLYWATGNTDGAVNAGGTLAWMAGVTALLLPAAAWSGVSLRREGLAASAALGLALGLASLPVLRLAGAPPPPQTSALQLAAALCFALGLAVAEEVVARGLLQGWLTRATGRPWLAILLSTALWVCLHLGDTEVPGARALQLGLTGLALGGACARWGLPAAILGHLAFNAATVIGAAGFP